MHVRSTFGRQARVPLRAENRSGGERQWRLKISIESMK